MGVCLSGCLFVGLFVWLFVCLVVCLFVSHGRALMRRPDAQTMVTVLGTHFGTQNFERHMSHRVFCEGVL